MIIGLTGKNASGKGEVAQYFQSKGYSYYSLSDVLRIELKKLGKPISRENLTWLGNKLRTEQGPSVLAKKIINQLKSGENVIVDSFRNPDEVKAFKTNPAYILMSVEATPKRRFERMTTRNRELDARTFEEFLQMDSREHSNNDPSKQNLEACKEMADYHLFNDGSLQELHEAIETLLSRISHA